MFYEYMVPVYAILVRAEVRGIETLPEQYQIPVAEYLAKEVEDKLK